MSETPTPDAPAVAAAPAPAPAPAAPDTAAPAAQPTPAPAPGVTIPPDEYRSLLDLRAKLAEIEREKAAELDAKEQARLKALAEKGESEKALAEQRASYEARVKAAEDKATALDAAFLNRELDATVGAAIAEAMAGRTFASPAAARHARSELARDIEVTRDAAGNAVVRERGTHRPAAEAIRERLASPDYSHFLAPSTTGGTGARGGANPGPAAPESAAASASDLLIELTRQQLSNGNHNPYAPGRRV